MNFWFSAHTGEPLPGIDEGQRTLRLGMIGQELIRKGHRVTWWTSAFEHVKKVHRFREFRSLNSQEGLTVNLLPGPGYPRNLSFARMRHNHQQAADFLERAEEFEAPDLILAPLPAPVIAAAAAEYGTKHKVPVVVDVRDLWPLAIVELFPRLLQPFARFFLRSMERDLRDSCIKARAVTGMTMEFVKWGVEKAGREMTEDDRAFRLSYPEALLAEDEGIEAVPHVDAADLNGRFVVTFIGTIGASVEFQPIVAAASLLAERAPDVLILIVGEGPHYEKYRRRSEGLNNLRWTGRVGRKAIPPVLKAAQAGIVPYRSTYNLRLGIPNKIGEYLAAGLPLVSGLTGRVARLVSEHEVGLSYRINDAKDLADCILRLRDEPRLREEMSRAARALYQREFKAEVVYADFADHLISLAGNG